jgi:hypothetical protein
MNNQELENPTYRIGTEVCFSADNDGTIVLDVRGGKFHSLIQSGSKVWSVLAAHPRGITRSDLVDHLMAQDSEFADEQLEDLEPAIQRILQQLTNDHLVETGPSHRSSLQLLKCRLCVAAASAVRRAGNTLIRFRGAQTAALIEFAFYEVIRNFGGFYARHKIIRKWPIANTRERHKHTDLPALCEVVHAAAVWYPKQTLCLQKASVTTSLLRQHGFDAAMKIGVRKQPFHAHAWVEVDGQVVGDHQNVRKYFREIASW